jgi:hypothetical protein
MMSLVIKTEGASPGASEACMFDHRCGAPIYVEDWYPLQDRRETSIDNSGGYKRHPEIHRWPLISSASERDSRRVSDTPGYMSSRLFASA